MTRFKAKGLDVLQLRRSYAADWRESGFTWLRLAATDRRMARLAGRSAGPESGRLRQSAIERARECLAASRQRNEWAAACGFRLPG
jgi:hypothetical protein